MSDKWPPERIEHVRSELTNWTDDYFYDDLKEALDEIERCHREIAELKADLLARRAVNALPTAEHLLEVISKRHPTTFSEEEQEAIQQLQEAIAEGKE